jgi:hypothetical protein
MAVSRLRTLVGYVYASTAGVEFCLEKDDVTVLAPERARALAAFLVRAADNVELMRHKAGTPGQECSCFAILAHDPTRHFKECIKRNEHPREPLRVSALAYAWHFTRDMDAPDWCVFMRMGDGTLRKYDHTGLHVVTELPAVAGAVSVDYGWRVGAWQEVT